jgi:hypothetical protein
MQTITVRKLHYLRETAEDEGEKALMAEEGPRIKAPPGCEWADTRRDLNGFGEWRRIQRTGEYWIFDRDGNHVEITVALQGFGWRDRRPGQKVEIPVRQKIAIQKGMAAKDAKAKVKSHNEADW